MPNIYRNPMDFLCHECVRWEYLFKCFLIFLEKVQIPSLVTYLLSGEKGINIQDERYKMVALWLDFLDPETITAPQFW